MATFDECIEFGKQILNINYELKPEQVDTVKNIFHGHDTISILPTGFGKSVIFQLLPFVMAVRTLRVKGIMACYLAFSGSCGMTYGDEDIYEDDMDISDYVLDEQVCEGVIQMRRQYWKLDDARNLSSNANEKTESEDGNGRPMTCLLYPGLTPSKLYDHLKNHGASDACILEWTRRLQILRRETDKRTKAYGIEMLGK